ncbi:MAG: hypothetical protein F4145_17045, partial [Boseongicola sp. SB0675_bin_26]|nr:hypothetical protein [Boseongicola sp. SB0675_bin_26]
MGDHEEDRDDRSEDEPADWRTMELMPLSDEQVFEFSRERAGPGKIHVIPPVRNSGSARPPPHAAGVHAGPRQTRLGERRHAAFGKVGGPVTQDSQNPAPQPRWMAASAAGTISAA